MIFVFLYSTVVVAYIACFVAFMNSKRGDEKYWDIFSSGFYNDSWKFEYQLMIVFGALFWPVTILGYLLYKVVYKQAEKFFGK